MFRHARREAAQLLFCLVHCVFLFVHGNTHFVRADVFVAIDEALATGRRADCRYGQAFRGR